MCGLAGRFHPAGLPAAPGWHGRADALLAHRGPDGAGHWADARCELVHRRLAIVDCSPTGAQPMTNETGDIVVAFNGEIYNHRALRAELARQGHAFRGTADTEVLVHLYEEAGERLVERLRGIFAFALYDARRGQLLLARDRYGVKPLYYAIHDGQLAFASEIKAILALPGFVPQLDRQACADFVALGYVPEPATGFANVRALLPATVCLVGADRSAVVRYDAVRAEPDPGLSLTAAADEAERALLDAVADQSVADVRVAALLSGGIDSGLVVAAHGAARGTATTAFTVAFPDPRHDESAVARRVARHVGVAHETVALDPRALGAEAIFDLLRHFDQPFADTSAIPTFQVAAAIRERGIVCALAGDGGDEVFGGYPRLWRAERLMRFAAAPGWCRRAAGRVGALLAPLTRDFGRQIQKAAEMAEVGRADHAALLAGLAAYLSEMQQTQLLVPEARRDLLPVRRLFGAVAPGGEAPLEALSRQVTATEFAVSLPSDMLRKVDMMSMRAGVEVRVPLLDERVVALGLRLRHRLKTDGRRGKLVLRTLARRWLPPGVATLRKRGFTIPLDVMVPPDFHDAVHDLLAGSAARTGPIVDRRLVCGWLEAFRRGPSAGHAISRGGLYQRVMTLVALELWLRVHGLHW